MPFTKNLTRKQKIKGLLLLLALAADKEPAGWEYASIAVSVLAGYQGGDVQDALTAAIYSANWYVRSNAAASLARQGLDYCLEGKISLEVECDPLVGPQVEKIIQNFRDTLDRKYAVSKDFENVYVYLLRRCHEANINKDPEIMEEVLRHLRSMRDNWKEVMKKVAGDKSNPVAQARVAGIQGNAAAYKRTGT